MTSVLGSFNNATRRMNGKPLTITTNYYNQSAFLVELVRMWDALPDEILNRVRFVVIDDGSRISAESALASARWRIDLQVYRILVDIPFNFAGTVNLGAAVATTEWLLHHDLDHVASAELLHAVLDLARPENNNSMFQFNLRFSDGRVDCSTSAHLLTADWFWRLGGWDEDFSGNYGFEDVHFLMKATQASNLSCVQTGLEFLADGRGPADMQRDSRRNKALLDTKSFSSPPTCGPMLRFPWQRVI